MAVDPYHLAYWQRAMAAQQTAREQAKVQAWHEAKAIATMLRQRFGATRVIVFGSLLGDRFAPQSDLDLAAADIPRDRYFDAVAQANGLSQRWVDLKPLEDLDPYFKQRLIERGIEIDA